MKKLQILGRKLSKTEQKTIIGGYMAPPDGCASTHSCGPGGGSVSCSSTNGSNCVGYYCTVNGSQTQIGVCCDGTSNQCSGTSCPEGGEKKCGK